ncbi:unnamed protein product [Adineta ricciae]|uniref:Dynein heavy chain tail domain-containing protein n=1 Tax=Adineta ricciae TaxID=249248 RepID=A0A815PW16_ADIRI|nr:unnamed protein product [Adineta ricciae]CAF1454990.1 unnamed protein product [Adineta ricciae]
MDDLRFRWLKDAIYTILDIDMGDPSFEDFLEGDDGGNELLVAKFLNEAKSNVDEENALIFHKEVFEELREEQVEITEEEWIEEQLAINPDFDPNAEAGVDNDTGDQQHGTSSNHPAGQNGITEKVDQTGDGTNGEGENMDELPPKPKRYRNELVKYLRTILYLCRDSYPSNLSQKNCVYFLRTTPGTIPAPSSTEDADKIMVKYLDYGLLNGHTLYLLANILNKVYNPILTYQSEEPEPVDEQESEDEQESQQKSKPSPEKQTEEHEKQMRAEQRRKRELEKRTILRDEFLIQLQKFLNQIGLTLRQLEGEVRLELPPHFDTNKIVKSNKDMVEQAENLVYKWNGEIREALERELKKTPQTPGPLGEIDWWRERNISLSSLYEQTKQEHVEKVLEKLDTAENAAPSSFRDTRTDLAKYYFEAKDNVKFLSTLERHFKNVTHGATFRVVTETLPKMMSALRMVWIISRHYNRDERMIPLMERIAHQLCERVARSINVRTLFSYLPSEIITKCEEAKKMLEQWKECYTNVRKEIEESGRDSRWEFDHKRLFKVTDHMAHICNDFIAIAKELEEFYNIFTPELKSVTGKPQKINEILDRVHKVLELIEHAPCDPFRIEDLEKWKMVHANYAQQIEEIDEQTKAFTSDSFKNLRSAESAFDMLLKFEKNNTRLTMQDEMNKRFSDILRQYDNEITEINNIFQHNKNNPPMNKNQPPYSGAIAWSRSLFRRIKHTMLRLHTKETLMQTEFGKQIKSYYLRVAKEMKAFEDAKFTEWRARTEQILPTLQKRNILKELPLAENQNPYTPRYIIDYDPQLNEMTTEARYLEQFDYILPETIRHLALNEERLKQISTQLKIVLKHYNRVIDSLEPHEQSLLEDHLRLLKRNMQTGTQRLPWTSTNHEKFITVTSEMISKLDSTINQVKKNAQDVQIFLDEIRHCNLFREPPLNPDGSLIQCREYFEFVEFHRRRDALELQKKYKLIGPLITKVEGLVFNTNTSQSPKMVAYYAYWERQILAALTELVTQNLKTLRETLEHGTKPLFQVDALLVVPTVAMQPNQNEIIKLFRQTMRDCVEV